MIAKHTLLFAILAFGICTPLAELTADETYPTRLVKLVVPSPPGGASEAVIRILAERLSSALGQPLYC